MDSRSRNLLAVVLTSVTAVLGSASLVHAAPKDAAAQKLQRDAMDNDYLAMNFADAESKLKQAIKTCGQSGCSPSVLAQIHRDLGVIYIGGLNQTAEGKAAFVAALKADPRVQLDEDLTTPEIQKAFDEAKRSLKGAPVDEEEDEAPRPTKTRRSTVVEGDLFHTPAAEQEVLTPVPVYVEAPDDIDVAKVEVRYKPFGASEWKTITLRKMGGGFGGEIPCQDIGTTTGNLSYYIQAIGPDGDIVGTTGSRSNPVQVPIRHSIDGDPPHLPNRPPPAKCDAAVDCPPGLPGCESKKKKKSGDKGWGASCESTSECEAGLVCLNGSCEVGDGEGGDEEVLSCEIDADCPEGVSCIDGICGGGEKKWWVSLTFQPDLAFMSGSNVCSPSGQQNDGYACFRQNDGIQYRGVPRDGQANAIAGGFAFSTIRILVGIDRVFAENFTAGARLGYAFNGGPETDSGTAFLPVHAEARVAYWFGNKPFASKGLRPYVFLAGGLAQVDAKIPVDIKEETDPSIRGEYEDYIRDDNQDFPESQKLDAWKKMGQGFVSAGGGIQYAAKPNHAFFVDLRVMQMFPTSGTVISPSLGYTIGF